MPKSPLFLPLLIFTTLLISALMVVTTNATGELDFSWTTATTKPGCTGSMAECMINSDDDEFGMDSEINRRILATTKYISYGALQRNNVPCSQRGASYYNCRPGAQANPYNRGCSAITRCRS
ncbi:hypothetical protein LIER_09861 [Lithospermum erythrorhizon]|uniref:Uncharacterized protein n=1 Tax=Lithospermum erythrorhizon TaxID=34254 RepID=A0AAV3PHD5_LITER